MKLTILFFLLFSTLSVSTPIYTPHPEMLSKKELRKRLTTKEVYTWYRGRLSAKTISSRVRADVRRFS